MLGIFKKIFSSANQRRIDAYEKVVKKINAIEKETEKLNEEEFKKLTFNKDEEESNLIKTFAAVREASKRTLGLRHFDCQLVGGLVLNDGNIAEMKTGEGKTLVATLPAVLNALKGNNIEQDSDGKYRFTQNFNFTRKIKNF